MVTNMKKLLSKAKVMCLSACANPVRKLMQMRGYDSTVSCTITSHDQTFTATWYRQHMNG